MTRASDEKWDDSWARGSTEGERYQPLGSRQHPSRFLHLRHGGHDSSPQFPRWSFFETFLFLFLLTNYFYKYHYTVYFSI